MEKEENLINKKLLAIAIKHLEAEIGGLKFQYFHKPSKNHEVNESRAKLIDALNQAIEILKKKKESGNENFERI